MDTHPSVARCSIPLLLLAIIAVVSCTDPGNGSDTPASPASALRHDSVAHQLQYGQLDCTRTHVGVLKAQGALTRSTYRCTATYIGKGWAITAAHCAGTPYGFLLLHGVDYQLTDFGSASFFKIHPDYSDNPGSNLNGTDIALMKVSGTWPDSGDPAIWPATVSTTPAAASEELTIVGSSESAYQQNDFARRFGTETVSTTASAGFEVVYAAPEYGATAVGGDSGSSTFRTESGVEKIVGIVSTVLGRSDPINGLSGGGAVRAWINTNCDSCLSSWSPPPPTFQYKDTNSAFCSALQGDTDQDGVADWKDNCPSTPNADQANCQGQLDFGLHGALKGDACDFSPCSYLAGLSSVNAPINGYSYMVWDKARVYLFNNGWTSSQAYVHKNLHAYYCACHDKSSPNPYQPSYYSDSDCKYLHCKDDGYTDANVYEDTGWQRTIWKANDDVLGNPNTAPVQSCAPVDLDSNTYTNECNETLPNRLFRRLYFDTSGTATGQGKAPTDFCSYWTDPWAYRVRWLDWDWHRQDYPHLQTFNFQEQNIVAVKVRLWVMPELGSEGTNRLSRSYTGPFFLGKHPEFILWALLTPLESETSILPDPPELLVFPALMLRSLAADRPLSGIEPYLWSNPPPPDAATIGLVVGRFDPSSGAIMDVVPSIVDSGTAVTTTGFSTVQWGDSIFAFGGKSQSGVRSATLWRGWPGQDGQGNPVYRWASVSEGGPPARTGAVLVANPFRNRLVLLLGETSSGAVLDAWAYSLDQQAWSQESLQVTGLQAVSDAGASQSEGVLYLYGGRGAQGPRDGLYRVFIGSLTGERVDTVSAPGPREGAALRFVPEAGALYMYGGKDAEGRRKADLWRFDLSTGAWALVHDGTGGPPAMDGAAVVASPVSGAVGVLAGHATGGAPQPAWRLLRGQWQSFAELTGVGQ